MNSSRIFDLTTSMHAWTRNQRRWAIALFSLLVGPFAAYRGWMLGGLFTQPDTLEYLNLAEGRPAMLPFASRQLEPLLVRALHTGLHVSVEMGFVVIATLCLLTLLAMTAYLLIDSGAPSLLFVGVAGLAFWCFQFNALVMPDVFYAALIACLLLLLRRRHFLGAALMMFPLMVARESTLLTLVCLLITCWRWLRWRDIAAAVLAAGAGILVVRHLSAGALPNEEHISPILYLFAKMPWNLTRNVLGIDVWANLYPHCGVPRWQFPLHIGSLQAVGACGFVPVLPFATFSWGLSSFGLLPLLLGMVLLRVRRKDLPASSPGEALLRFALVYGGISFLMAPLLGESIMRLFDYAWPLFFVGLPQLMSRLRLTLPSNRIAGGFLALHVVLCWLATVFFGAKLLVVGVLIYVAAWLLVRRGFSSFAPAPAPAP